MPFYVHHREDAEMDALSVIQQRGDLCVLPSRALIAFYTMSSTVSISKIHTKEPHWSKRKKREVEGLPLWQLVQFLTTCLQVYNLFSKLFAWHNNERIGELKRESKWES